MIVSISIVSKMIISITTPMTVWEPERRNEMSPLTDSNWLRNALCFPLHRATFNVTLEHSALHYFALRLTLHICYYVTLQLTLLWHLQCKFYMALHCAALTKHKCTVLNYVTIRYIALHWNGCITLHCVRLLIDLHWTVLSCIRLLLHRSVLTAHWVHTLHSTGGNGWDRGATSFEQSVRDIGYSL